MRTTKEVTIGQIVYDNNDILGYELDQSDNGMCYKDLSAWESGKGIIYIPESEGINYGGFIPEDEVDCICAWTKETWLEFVREVIMHHNYEEIATLSAEDKELLIEFVAYNCLCECDWQELSTELEGWNWEDCIVEIMQEIHDNRIKEWLNNCVGSRIELLDDNVGKVLVRDITIEHITIEDDLTNNEDYRLVFGFKDKVVTLWYLPTRVINVVYITECAIEH